MGEGTTPGCCERSADGAAVATGVADTGAKLAGIDAAILRLRATRTRRPARSISISVKLVSSSKSASSRMSALSSFENAAAALSSGWRAMILKSETREVVGVWLVAGVVSGPCLDADPGGKA